MSNTKIAMKCSFKEVTEVDTVKMFEPKHIYVNEPKGIVRVTWPDHTRTSSMRLGDDVFSVENGFRACLAKKIFGGYQGYTKYFKKAVYNKKK